MKSSESPDACSNPSRRQFLQLAALAGGIAFIGGCSKATSSVSSDSSDSPASGTGLGGTYNPIKAIEKSDQTLVIPGGGKLKPETALAFMRGMNNPGILYAKKDGSLEAISALCTHQGCTVRWQGADKPLLCPCHGSKFTLDGKVQNGPAMEDLPTYKARKQGDDAVISL